MDQNFTSSPVQEIVYNTTELQKAIDISPSTSGVMQIECSNDAKYSVLGSILPEFTPKPLPEAQNITGPACFGAFVAVQTLQLNIVSLGTGQSLKVQLVIS